MNSKKAFSVVLSLVLIVTLIGCKNTDHFHDVTGDPWPDPFEWLRGTTVRYVTTDSFDGGKYDVAINYFEQTYGIDVVVQLLDERTALSSLAADIAAGIQGDVFRDNRGFPHSLSVLQPLEAAELDLNDPMWNQSIIKASTFDGRPYLIDAIGNVWADFDVCVYNKKIFEENNIKTPKDYYEEGNWTFENFRFAANEVAKLGEEYTGVGILDSMVYGIAGSSFYTYKDDQIYRSDTERLMETMRLLSDMKTDKLAILSKYTFSSRKEGMALTTASGLNRFGRFGSLGNDMGVTYLPVLHQGDKRQLTAAYQGWGVIDGARNPVGAGLFIKEFINHSHYDKEDWFVNDEVRRFFEEVSVDEITYYYAGDLDVNLGIAWDKYSSESLSGYFKKTDDVMDNTVEYLNGITETERAQIKEAEEKGYFK